MDIQELLNQVYEKMKNKKGGKNAEYIPELKNVDPTKYAISIFTLEGKEFNVGDSDLEVAIESVSKVFSLALALEENGELLINNMIGSEKSYRKFNSLKAIENSKNRTINPFVNGGAMATTSILHVNNKSKFKNKITNNMNQFAGRKLSLNKKTFQSEMNFISHNYSIGYLLESYSRFYADVPETIEVYTHQCSLNVKSKDIAVMAATLANDGKNPKTGKKVIEKKNIKPILKNMMKHGLYDYSDIWCKKVGMPAKSDVGGVIMLVVPNVMGIGIISPPLDEHGNSYKGILTAEELIKKMKIKHLC